MSRLSWFYTAAASFIVLFYVYSTATGQEFFHPAQEKTTQEEKRSGYRGRHFIFIHHGGFRGK